MADHTDARLFLDEARLVFSAATKWHDGVGAPDFEKAAKRHVTARIDKACSRMHDRRPSDDAQSKAAKALAVAARAMHDAWTTVSAAKMWPIVPTE